MFHRIRTTRPRQLMKTTHRRLAETKWPQVKYGFVKVQEPKADLDMIGGYQEMLQQMTDIVLYLQNPPEFTKNDIKPPKGVILSGPPGVGKTFLAEAIAGHAGVPFILVSAAEITDRFIGGNEQNLRRVFETAQEHSPCVLCLDEIDSIANKRFDAPKQSADLAGNSTVNQLLSLLGQHHPGVVVIGTTNHYDTLDPAITRPGRFDKHLVVALPNAEDRMKILSVHTKNKQLDPSVKLDLLAKLSDGFSGAKIASWVNEAAMMAAREKITHLLPRHFGKARNILQSGSLGRRNTNLLSKKFTAIHEAGHVIVGHILGDKLYRISVLITANGPGETEFIFDNRQATENDLLNEICRSLGGRAAEKLFNSKQAGSVSDLERAKAIALHMIGQEGMGDSLTGINTLYNIEKMLTEQMQRAEEILKNNIELLNRIVNALMIKDELYSDDFIKLVNNQALPEIEEIKNVNQLAEQCQLPPKKLMRASFFDIPKNLGPVLNQYDNMSTTGTPVNENNRKPAQTPPMPVTPVPLTIEEVANALYISANQIRKCETTLIGYMISLKPSFHDDEHMKKISLILKNHDVENYYFHHRDINVPELTISQDGIQDFIKYVKEKNRDLNDNNNQSTNRPK